LFFGWLAIDLWLGSQLYGVRSIVDEPVFELLKLGRTVIQKVSFPDARQAAANLALDISTRH
jgi:hypothetical protein